MKSTKLLLKWGVTINAHHLLKSANPSHYLDPIYKTDVLYSILKSKWPTKIYILLPYLAVILCTNCLLTGELFAQTTADIPVNQNFLLWKKGLTYRTEVTGCISLTDTTIRVEEPKKGVGHQNCSFHYYGSMAYNTELDRASEYNGTAKRYYQKSQIGKLEEADPITLKLDVNIFEVWLYRLRGLPWPSKDLSKNFDIESNAELFGQSYITIRQKDSSDNVLYEKTYKSISKDLNELTDRHLLFEWDRSLQIQKGKIRVSAIASNDTEKQSVEKSSVNSIIKDVIGRETKLLYDALLGSSGNRKAGDVWLVDGSTLDALVHPSLEGSCFRGKLLVQAESIINESPDQKIGKFNGLKLKFIPTGVINGRTQEADLQIILETMNQNSHTIKLVPKDGFTGEIWLDSENQCVRYGKLKIENKSYSGYLPKVSDLNDAKINLTATLNMELTYIQSISKQESNDNF